jgi:hypothetical protein
VGGATLAVWKIFNFRRERDRLWKERVLGLHSQMGDLPTKEDRRRRYEKHKESRALAELKKYLPKKNSNVARKRLEKMRKKFKPQFSSASLVACFTKLANVKGIEMDDAMLSRIENLGALFVAVKDCVTVSAFLSTIFLYIKTHCNKSIANVVAQYLADTLGVDFDAQAGEFGVKPKKEKPKWLTLLKDLQYNWSLVAGA